MLADTRPDEAVRVLGSVLPAEGAADTTSWTFFLLTVGVLASFVAAVGVILR